MAIALEYDKIIKYRATATCMEPLHIGDAVGTREEVLVHPNDEMPFIGRRGLHRLPDCLAQAGETGKRRTAGLRRMGKIPVRKSRRHRRMPPPEQTERGRRRRTAQERTVRSRAERRIPAGKRLPRKPAGPAGYGLRTAPLSQGKRES